ncbi:MAG: carbohydrate binding domain-containing protein [Verrucomicrobiota bacterium]
MRSWLLFLLLTAPAVADEPLFPFVLPWDDATTNIVNVSDWLVKPAGKDGYVVARDGHFYAGTRRVRFFGVNLVAPAAFPQHADADKIAARMAKFGINCVRFHHMDAEGWSPLLNGGKLDPAALDRLDYLIAQLKRHGIYANLNLLVSRNFKIPGLDAKDQHVLGFFDPAMLDLQKDYARQLLTHTNAYTKLPYTHDPAVAIVEINNENGLIQAALGGRLDRLPADKLRAQWNDWLKRRYGTTEKLRTAWKAVDEPLGAELLTGPWVLEQHAGSHALRSNDQITVTTTGVASWHVQYNHPGLAITQDLPVTLSFRAKADRPCEVTAALMQAHEPWRSIGFDTRVNLTTDWQTFHFTFTPTQTDPNARLNFSNLGQRLGHTWFADISLRPGGQIGCANLGAVAFGGGTAEGKRDWFRFLWETEDRYWQTMYRFLKDDLKVHANIIGTIVGCSPVSIQAKLDAVDAHAYWQHPDFPGKPWDADNWIVENKSMVNELGGTLPGLATRRVPGKPFCVTEYNHPSPNSFSSEAFPLLAAMAGLQDWDAIFAFAYSHRKDDWDARHFANFFDIDQQPVKMATLPAAAAMFLRGDVPVSRDLAMVKPDFESELAGLPGSPAWGFGLAGARPASLLNNAVFQWQPGVVTLNTPQSRAVIGYTGGHRYELGNIVVEPDAAWSAITLTEIQNRRWLITATGAAANTGMQWKDAKKNSVGKNWGNAPSLIEGITAKIKMPGVVHCWALDERGQRMLELPVEQGQFEIGPKYQTLWYEVSCL